MRRWIAAASVAALGAGARADGGAAAPETIRKARDAICARPEFRYGGKKARSFLEDLWDAYEDWIQQFHESHPHLFTVLMIALALLLVALVAHIVWTLRTARRAEWQTQSFGGANADLRSGDPRPLRARAVGHAGAGRFDEAVRDLYAALLIALDRRGAVRYAPYKALLDYRMEAARDAAARTTLDLFAAAYLPGSFGRRPPDRAHFDELLHAFDVVAEAAT